MEDGAPFKELVFVKNVINHPRIEIGDFTYYDDMEQLTNYVTRVAPYLSKESNKKLIMGSFAQMACGTRFITESGNHHMAGLSTYPFRNFNRTQDISKEEFNDMFNIEP